MSTNTLAQATEIIRRAEEKRRRERRRRRQKQREKLKASAEEYSAEPFVEASVEPAGEPDIQPVAENAPVWAEAVSSSKFLFFGIALVGLVCIAGGVGAKINTEKKTQGDILIVIGVLIVLASLVVSIVANRTVKKYSLIKK